LINDGGTSQNAALFTFRDQAIRNHLRAHTLSQRLCMHSTFGRHHKRLSGGHDAHKKYDLSCSLDGIRCASAQ
jgi:hypothetical protein